MKKGFTLIEFLIYLALLSVVVVSLFYWSISLVEVRDRGRARSEVLASGRVTSAFIKREIEQAEWVISPVPNATADSLSVAGSEFGSQSEFHLSDEELLFSVDGGLPETLISKSLVVSGLEFRNLTPPLASRDSIVWQFSVRYPLASVEGQFYEKIFSGTASVRLKPND